MTGGEPGFTLVHNGRHMGKLPCGVFECVCGSGGGAGRTLDHQASMQEGWANHHSNWLL